MRLACLVTAVIAIAACAATEPMGDLVFLTREDCVQTTVMRARLDAAIEATGKPVRYVVVNLDSLPATDERTGYPTPTILRDGVDLFGMTPPAPPYPEPT